MTRKFQIIASVSVGTVVAFSALAQDTANSKTDRLNSAQDSMPEERRMHRLHGAAKASDLIGITVKNYQDEKLGTVADLAVDMESGRIVQVILSTGGFAGVGNQLTAVPPGALHHDIAQKVLHLDITKEKLKAAPKFELSKWAEHSGTNHLTTVYSHYGEESALTFIECEEPAKDGKRAVEKLPTPVPERNLDGTWAKNHHDNQPKFMIPTSRLSQLQKASKLMGMAVKNLQGEKLGKIENLLVDLSSGRIVAVILSSGGFLGMGDELSAVPPTALRFNSERDTLQLDASKDMLSQAPHFKANQWPDFSQPEYAHGIYRAYRVEPYFTTNAVTAADNTARNVRDRDDRTLTPFDQGNSQADIDTTAQIRKEIIAGKSMSVNAKNVKIITNKGRVTLRGPVNTSEEKRLIGEIAIRIAQSVNVDNQLEVK